MGGALINKFLFIIQIVNRIAFLLLKAMDVIDFEL